MKSNEEIIESKEHSKDGTCWQGEVIDAMKEAQIEILKEFEHRYYNTEEMFTVGSVLADLRKELK